MRSPDLHRLRLRRSHRLALLAASAALLGLGSGGPVQAQDDPAAKTGDELFGVYQLEARGSGVQTTYTIEGILPGGSPILDLTMPETLARFSSGPTGYGLASLAYPGGLLVNLGSLGVQAGFDGAENIPDYPMKAEAFYPTGPTTVDTSRGATVQKAVTGDLGVLAQGTYPSSGANPALTVGSITSAARSSIEGALAVSRTRVVLDDVSLLGGLLTIDSVVTDLVAAHDGTTGSTAGGTVASGVRFLGLAASLTEDGLVLQEGPAPDGPAAPAGDPLSGLVGPIDELSGPVQDALATVLDQAVPSVDDLLAQAGVSIRILDPHDQAVDSGAASRITTGLAITLRYEGREQDALVDLINSVPDALKPSVGPIPNPITFLAENHITGLSLAPASVSALASPPFDAIDFPTPSFPAPDLGGVAPSESLGDPGFTTPAAPLPEPSVDLPPALVADSVTDALGGAVPAILVALLLLASPLFGVGATRLADNVLAPATTRCPVGLDEPPPH